jgi:anti-sigma-K factor RskA
MNAPAEEIHAAAGAYALNALDDLERARFEAHLARCTTCRQDVADFRATAEVLAAAVAEEPPPRLRADVLAAIRDVRQESPLAPRSLRARAPRPWLLTVGAAAAIAIIGLLAVLTIDARNERDDAELVAQTMAASDARTVELMPLESGGAGHGRLVWSESEGRAVLVLDALPDPGEGRAYELWFIEQDTPRPMGAFRQDGGRLVAIVDEVPAGAQMVAVTEGPEEGSPLPVGPLLLAGEPQGT